jgi:ATP-dependent protease HslVU (ClpYQ) peptidase subunit
MTCIVGLVDGSDVIVGGDSAGVAGLSLVVRKDPKVFRVGEFLIGYTSSFRMGQLLHYKLSPPEIDGTELHRYMATSFVDAVRDCFKSGGYARKDSEVESAGNFVVAVRGRLFEVESDYQIAESVDGVASCGCGSDIALGAIFASKGKSAEDRVRIALQAAERYSGGVRAPFTVERLSSVYL